MNQFIEQLDQMIEDSAEFTQQHEDELLEHILEHSCYTSLSEFAMTNISYEQALEIVQTDDQFDQDALDWVNNRS